MEWEDITLVLLVVLAGDVEGFACGEGFGAGSDVTAVTTIYPQAGTRRH